MLRWLKSKCSRLSLAALAQAQVAESESVRFRMTQPFLGSIKELWLFTAAEMANKRRNIKKITKSVNREPSIIFERSETVRSLYFNDAFSVYCTVHN